MFWVLYPIPRKKITTAATSRIGGIKSKCDIETRSENGSQKLRGFTKTYMRG